jgi:hypothetical protein
VRIEAIIVNHNTSPYAELALRSLRATTSRDDLNVTVVDNHSADDTSALRAACDRLEASFELSRWPVEDQSVNTHGDVLRDFVLARADCDAYLFLDADIVFTQDRTVDTMSDELMSADAVWAVQARMSWDGTNEIPMGSLWQRRDHEIHLASKRVQPGTDWPLTQLKVHSGTVMPRCHPGCALVRNSQLLRGVADRLGFSTAWVWSDDPQLGGFADTFALASEVMRSAGLRIVLSDAMVVHFFNVTYDIAERLAAKGERRDGMLAELRERQR